MGRTRTTESIVLRNSRIGEIHKGLVLLTPAEGLLRPIAHGAYSQKGKLRGTTNFLCCGTAYLYGDPVRDSLKLTDMQVKHFFSGIREELTRFYVASLWAEAILHSYATGDETGALYTLFVEALHALNDATPEQSKLINVQFLWRFLALSGLEPDLETCAVSGEPLHENEPIFYSRTDHGFCTSEFAQEHMTVWRPGTAAYMRHTTRSALSVALRAQPPQGALPRIKRVLFALLEDHLERSLKTLQSGAAIL